MALGESIFEPSKRDDMEYWEFYNNGRDEGNGEDDE